MPARKKLAVALAVLAGLGLVAAGTLLLVHGRAASGLAVVAATVFAGAWALQTFWVPFDLTGDSLRKGRRDRRQVALTFDDGPGPDTPAVLDALDLAGVKATFFVLGAAVREWPALVREAARRGHLIALHGYSHRKLHLAGPRSIADELDRGGDAIRGAGVEPAPFFRAPHGFKGPLVGRALRRRGLRLVGWTRGVWDTERPGAQVIAERACARPKGGEILLLHDGCGTPGLDPRRDQTAAAIPEIARRWRAAGFDFVTVDALEAEERARRMDLSRLTRWAGLLALAALTVLAARKLDPAALGRAFAEADPAILAAAAGANLLALVMQAGRWLAIVHPIEPRARPRDAFFTLVAGYAVGLVVPARASDLARAHLMARRSGASTATLTATAVVDHLLGSVALCGVLGLMAAFSGLPLWLRSAGSIAFAGAGAALLALWFLRPRGELPPRGGVAGVVQRLRQGLVAVGRPRALALSWAFALGGWSAEGLIGWLTLRAFGLPATMEATLLVVLATTLSSAASISPGNAGAFELACVVALATLGVPREPALAFAIGYHVVHVVPVALLGGGWLLTHGYRSALVREEP